MAILSLAPSSSSTSCFSSSTASQSPSPSLRPSFISFPLHRNLHHNRTPAPTSFVYSPLRAVSAETQLELSSLKEKTSLDTEPLRLWQRYLDWLYQNKDLGLYVDVSRVGFPDEFVAKMEEKFERAFAAMEKLEGGAISNPDESRMVGHYWLRKPELAPNAFLRKQIEEALDRVSRFADDVVSGKVAFGTNTLYKIADAVWDIHGQSTLEQPRSKARIVASLDSDGGKADGARKALEQAFQGKNNIAKKWEEEIRKRELSGGDGGSGGGSGGGGGSWGGGGGGVGGGGDEEMGENFGQDEPWDWEEAGQTFMATFALIILYISITHGPKQVLKKFKLLFRYIRQGFRLRKIPEEYLEGPEDDSDEEYEEGDSDVDDDDNAQDDFIRNRHAEQSISNAQEDDEKNDSGNDETEDEEDDDLQTPSKQRSKREDLLSKRQAEQKEKLLQLLTPKELRQQEENK